MAKVMIGGMDPRGMEVAIELVRLLRQHGAITGESVEFHNGSLHRRFGPAPATTLHEPHGKGGGRPTRGPGDE